MLNLLKDRNIDSSLANNIKLSSKSKLSMYKINFNTKKHTIQSILTRFNNINNKLTSYPKVFIRLNQYLEDRLKY